MANFGGAIKLTGADEYRRALSQITQNLKVVSSEMKAVASSADKEDSSMESLRNKSTQLSTTLERQRTALTMLKSVLSGMQGEYAKMGNSHAQLVEKYENEKAKLTQLEQTLGKSSQEYKNQEKVVDELGLEVEKSAKAYDQQGKAINDMRIKTANAETTMNQTAKSLDELGNEAQEAGKKAEKSGEGFTVMKGILANLGTQAIQSVLAGIKKLGSAIVGIGKQAVDGFSEMEQLKGGVEKLFGESADTVMKNAENAFATAGLSANEYMETVTGFSASLISSLGGDTEKAVALADTAIKDMSDNANVFGSDMGSIQHAYQGFAKQNYTMLDNLNTMGAFAI